MKHIYVPMLLLQLGFKHNQPKGKVWESRCGIRVTSYGKHRVPYRRARVVFLYISELAMESGSVVKGSIQDMCARFGVTWDKYATEKQVLRLLQSVYEQREQRNRCCQNHCFTHKPVEFITGYKYCKRTKSFVVHLSDAFVDSVRQGARCSRDEVCKLIRSNSLSALDLYIYYRWRVRCGEHRTVSMCGSGGPYAWLSNATHEKKQRQHLRDYHKVVVKQWPECPFVLLDEGKHIAHRDKLLKEREDREARRRATKQRAARQRARILQALEPFLSADKAARSPTRRAAPRTKPSRFAHERARKPPKPAEKAQTARSRASPGSSTHRSQARRSGGWDTGQDCG